MARTKFVHEAFMTSRTFISSGRTACGICRGFDSQKPNYILLCDGCGFAAHQECYGVAIVPQENWYCDECATSFKKAIIVHHPTMPPARPKPSGIRGSTLKNGTSDHVNAAGKRDLMDLPSMQHPKRARRHESLRDNEPDASTTSEVSSSATPPLIQHELKMSTSSDNPDAPTSSANPQDQSYLLTSQGNDAATLGAPGDLTLLKTDSSHTASPHTSKPSSPLPTGKIPEPQKVQGSQDSVALEKSDLFPEHVITKVAQEGLFEDLSHAMIEFGKALLTRIGEVDGMKAKLEGNLENAQATIQELQAEVSRSGRAEANLKVRLEALQKVNEGLNAELAEKNKTLDTIFALKK